MIRAPQNYLKAFLPNPAQELLLQAALSEGDEAINAWRGYLSRVEFDDTDYGSSRILSLVYRNLHSQGFEDPYMGRMKGIYRRTWAENQKNFQHLHRVFAALGRAGIPAMLLKGSALILLCYRDLGLRAMGDFDVAVPAPRVHEAVAILEGMKWKTCLEYPKLQIELHHAVHLQNAAREDLDLHWHILVHRCEDAFDRPFWEGARPIDYKGSPLLSLQPADHLLHASIHAAAWSPTSPLRWVADAYYLTRHCEIDWERVLAMGEFLGVIPALQATLPYLKERFSAKVPEGFLSQLLAAECPEWQRRELRALCRPHGFFGMLPMLWERHSREGKRSKHRRSFPDYLKTFYGLGSYGELGRYFLSKTWKKLNTRFRDKSWRSPKRGRAEGVEV